MIAASVALAYFGYQGAQDVVASYKGTFVKNAGAQARGVSEQVEEVMDLTVNAFFSEVTAAIDDTFLPEKQRCAVRPSPMIQAYAIYREKPQKSFDCAGPEGSLSKSEANQLHRQIMNDHGRHFPWTTLIAGKLKYVHLNEEKGLLFVLAKHRGVDNEGYFLVARLDLGYIRSYLISDELRKLCKTYRVSLVNADTGKALPEMVCGGSEPRTNEPQGFLYNERFGGLLYAWNLRMAHQDEEMQKLQKRLEREKIIQPLFVLVSTVIIAVGLGIVMLSVVAERRASRLKSDFIANVSHELKTPLSLIRMFGELVATGRHKGEEMVREYGGIITRESERLSHLIDNVLDFARLERGKASYDFLEGDLAAVLERSLDICRYRLDKDRIRLRVLVERDLPPVRMDDNAITLVILNLVDNALKYGADGGAVDVALERAPGGVVLAVRDFGPGVPKEEQGRIFERFYRAQTARDRNVRGSGIGLSLVRHIAEAHGGRVTVESPVRGSTGPDNGSIFRVFLPAPIIAGGLADGHSAEQAAGGVKMDAAAGGEADPASSAEWRPIKS
jgi:two-component system, OmpR family, phosphate regulon sensor histidine kinase PhoR